MEQKGLEYELQKSVAPLSWNVRLAIILAPFLLSTLLPIWTIWYVGSWEMTGELRTFWRAAQMAPYELRQLGFARYASMCGVDYLKTMAVTLALGIGCERILAIRMRRAAKRSAAEAINRGQ